jgi:hypothetical protein
MTLLAKRSHLEPAPARHYFLRIVLEQGTGAMTKIVYHIVEHDGGWAYQVDGAFSETFPSHEAARRAALLAATEQHMPGETRAISWEDSKGKWHEEVARGDDRPEAEVEG